MKIFNLLDTGKKLRKHQLMQASATGDAAVTRRLLEKGTNPNKISEVLTVNS